MPGPSSNPALTADLGCNLRDRHPEIFSPPSMSPAIPPMGRRSLLGRLMAGALGLAFSPK